jgi:lipopolysaccharide biosynthesis glycosyltransferase
MSTTSISHNQHRRVDHHHHHDHDHDSKAVKTSTTTSTSDIIKLHLPMMMRDTRRSGGTTTNSIIIIGFVFLCVVVVPYNTISWTRTLLLLSQHDGATTTTTTTTTSSYTSSRSSRSASELNLDIPKQKAGADVAVISKSGLMKDLDEDEETRTTPSSISTTTIVISDHNETSSLDMLNNNQPRASHERQRQRQRQHRRRRYAYTWVLGGIDSTRPAYKGFLYGILVSVNILKKLGSTKADFIVLTQLSSSSSSSHNATTTTMSGSNNTDTANGSVNDDNELPKEDERLLREMGIQIRHLPKPPNNKSSFAQLVYEKFRPLQYTEYDRIMFLDADIIPLNNLDYLFDLSSTSTSTSTSMDDEIKKTTKTKESDNIPVPLLRPNLVIATRGEPCNTGLFIMNPTVGAYDELQGIIRRQHEQGHKLPYPHFSKRNGWGHNFKKHGDYWESVRKQHGVKWNFHAAHSDQGLWYYYTKYFKQDVSIIIGSKLQTITPGENSNEPQFHNDTTTHALLKYSPEPILYNYGCGEVAAAATVAVEANRNVTTVVEGEGGHYVCNPVYRDFAHFMGRKKPWTSMPCSMQRDDTKKNKNCTSVGPLHKAHMRWYEELTDVNTKLSMGLDIDDFENKHIPDIVDSPLGYIAKFQDNKDYHTLSHQQESVSESEAKPTKQQQDQKETTTASVVSVAQTFPTTSENNATTTTKETSHTVAYAISLIKCGDWQSNSAGLIDASLVLRHSIHKISKRTKDSGSKYDYKMYAIVHRDAEQCSKTLTDVGFDVRVVDPPILQSEIRGEFLRKTIHKEVCCGVDEFIKLYAYTLPEDIIVHVDIDFAFFKPMDDLFDAILYDKDSIEGKAARNNLLLEKPTDDLPDKIEVFFTRDWPQVAPNKFPAAYQAGFMVARRNPTIVDEMVSVIRVGNYSDGWGVGFGWGGMGYGGYVGARAMQGFIAYFYDHIRKNTHVELNHCRYNHMGMDVLYRNSPNFHKRHGNVGSCRNGEDKCEDCMATQMEVRRLITAGRM